MSKKIATHSNIDIEQFRFGKHGARDLEKLSTYFNESNITDLKLAFWSKDNPFRAKAFKKLPKEQQKEIIDSNTDLESITNDTLEFGGNHIVSKKGHGKTYLQKVLTETMIQKKRYNGKEICVIIFDTTFEFRKGFNTIPFVSIQDTDFHSPNYSKLIQKRLNYNIQDEFRNKEKLKFIKEILFKGIKISKLSTYFKRNLLFDIQLSDVDTIGTLISIICEIIDKQQREFKKKHLKLKKEDSDKKGFHYVFVIDECQNVFGERAGNKNVFKRMMKIYSEARNFNESFITSSQRLQEVSTKIRAKMNYYLFGKISAEDIYLKIARLAKYGTKDHKKFINALKTAPKGEFFYFKDDEMKHLKKQSFRAKGKPFDVYFRHLTEIQRDLNEKAKQVQQKAQAYRIMTKPKQKGIIDSILDFFFPHRVTNRIKVRHRTTTEKPIEYYEEQDDEQEESDGILFLE